MTTSAQTTRTTVRDRIRGHQLSAFFGLTLLLSWGWWLLAYAVIGNGELTRGIAIPGAFGPAIAATIVTWTCRGQVRHWLREVVAPRVAPRWYLLALGVPLLIAGGGLGTTLAIAGAPMDVSLVHQRLPLFMAALLVAATIGGGQEELGWRGFALPRLQARFSALGASLIIGVVWAVWHLPLFLLGAPRNQTGSVLLYGLLVIGFSIVMTWWYNSTGGSVLLAMLLHGGINASGNLVPLPLEAAGQWPVVIDVGMLAGVWAAVVVVLALNGTETLSRHGLPGRVPSSDDPVHDTRASSLD